MPPGEQIILRRSQILSCLKIAGDVCFFGVISLILMKNWEEKSRDPGE